MSEQTESYSIFEDVGFIEPKAEERAELIAKLQKGDFTLSFSSLTAFAISPRSFIAYKLRERKTTAAMQMGEAVHCLILEPDKFDQRYFIAPDVNGATKEGKAAWAKIYEDFVGEMAEGVSFKIDEIKAAVHAATGTTVIDGKSAAEAKFRARQVVNNRAARHLLEKITRTERKIDFEFEGLNFKGMIDGDGPGCIIDIKNMPDASLNRASGAIWGRRLHWQAFGYDRALGGGNLCHIIAVDGFGEVSVHRFTQSNLDKAEREMKEYIHHFKRAIVESVFDDEVWSSSQEFWLQSMLNEYGINVF